MSLRLDILVLHVAKVTSSLIFQWVSNISTYKTLEHMHLNLMLIPGTVDTTMKSTWLEAGHETATQQKRESLFWNKLHNYQDSGGALLD